MPHIDFYFEFSSPYGYLAATWIEDFAAANKASLAWHPFLMGAVFQRNDMKPLTTIPIKGDYAVRDFERTARREDIALSLPKPFPFMAVAACRAFYAVEQNDPETAVALAKALYQAAFGQGSDISTGEAVCKIAGDLGLDGAALSEKIISQPIKDRLFAATDAAIERGVFGSPFFFVDEEPFWGNEKREDMQRWIETGGW